MSWTQPCCERCWVPFVIGVRQELLEPTRLIEPEQETCAFCGDDTSSGIYVRADPKQVPYSRQED
jgi:hypothetical protein